MRRSRFILLIAVAVAGLALSFLWQHRAEATLRQNDSALRQQQEEINRATAKNPSSNDVGQTNQSTVINSGIVDYAAELSQLRAQAAALRAQEIQLSNQQWSSRVSAGVNLLSIVNSNLLEHNKTLEATMNGGPRPTSGKLNDARGFATALMRYAAGHEGFFPSTLDEVTAYFPQPLTSNSAAWDNAPISGTNGFEIVYQGGLIDLSNVPVRRIALLRESQPWLTLDGKWAKTYAFTDGAAEIVVSDDNFQSWDAMHVVPPPGSP